MAIAFVSGSSFTGTTAATSASCTAPAGIVAGNVLLAFVSPSFAADQAPTITGAGWILLAQGAGTKQSTMAVLARVAGSAEPSSYTFKSSVSATFAIAIAQYSGATLPLDGSAINQQDSAFSATMTANTVTASGAADVWVTAFGVGGASASMSTPTGFTQRVKTLGTSVCVGVFDEQLSASGSTGSTTSTISSTFSWTATSVLLLPGTPNVVPAIDSTGSAVFSTAASGSAVVTTTWANDIIVVLAYAEKTASPAPSVSSVTATGLTFSNRSINTAAGTQQSGAQQLGVEVWWAVAATAQAYTITVTYAAAIDDAVIHVFAATDCNTSSPWDSNASLPAKSHTTTSASPSSTISSGTGLAFVANGAGTNTVGTVASGYTQILNTQNAGGTNFCVAGSAYQAEWNALTSATFAPFSNSFNDWVNTVDVLIAGSTAASPYLPHGAARNIWPVMRPAVW